MPSLNRDIANSIGVAVENDVITETGEVSGGVTSYSTINDLPTAGNEVGDQAFVTGNDRLYIWSGAGWYNIALINNTPTINRILDSDNDSDWTSFALNTDGSTSTITIVATDPEGFDVTYTTTTDSGFDGLATVSGDSSVFTITPLSEDSATETSGTITFRASDGINIASAIRTFTLSFVTYVDVQKNASFGSLLAKPYCGFAPDGTLYLGQGYSSFTGATGNQIAMHKITKSGSYDWTTILGNSVNNYNGGFDPAALAATDTNLFYNSKHPDTPSSSILNNHFIGRVNVSTGAVADLAVVRYGNISTSHNPAYFERSATSGSMLYVSGMSSGTSGTVYMYKHPDNAVYQSGDTINQSSGSHFYRRHTITASSVSNYYVISANLACELSDGSIISVFAMVYDSNFTSYNLMVMKFNSDGTYNSRGYTSNTFGTKGYLPNGVCVDDSDNIYIHAYENSSTSNKTYHRIIKLNSSLVEQDRESFQLANATVSHQDNTARLNGELVFSGGYIYLMHRSLYSTTAYWTLVRMDPSDLSATAYQYDYVQDAAAWTLQEIVNGNKALFTNGGGDISTHSTSSWPFTLSNSPNSSATPSEVTVNSYGTNFPNWSWSTTTSTSGISSQTLTPVNVFGSYPTTYGASANYYNINQTSSSLANPTVSII